MKTSFIFIAVNLTHTFCRISAQIYCRKCDLFCEGMWLQNNGDMYSKKKRILIHAAKTLGTNMCLYADDMY